MSIPVKLKVDDFNYQNETFEKGAIFNAPHEAMASFMCEQEGIATRVKAGYTTRVATPDEAGSEPALTPKKSPSKSKAKKSKAKKADDETR